MEPGGHAASLRSKGLAIGLHKSPYADQESSGRPVIRAASHNFHVARALGIFLLKRREIGVLALPVDWRIEFLGSCHYGIQQNGFLLA